MNPLAMLICCSNGVQKCEHTSEIKAKDKQYFVILSIFISQNLLNRNCTKPISLI